MESDCGQSIDFRCCRGGYPRREARKDIGGSQAFY